MKIGLQVIVFTNKKELTSMLQVRNRTPTGEANVLARLGNTKRFGIHNNDDGRSDTVPCVEHLSRGT